MGAVPLKQQFMMFWCLGVEIAQSLGHGGQRKDKKFKQGLSKHVSNRLCAENTEEKEIWVSSIPRTLFAVFSEPDNNGFPPLTFSKWSIARPKLNSDSFLSLTRFLTHSLQFLFLDHHRNLWSRARTVHNSSFIKNKSPNQASTLNHHWLR